MPRLDFTLAELRYLAQMNAENLRVMEFMVHQKGLTLPDLSLAQQLHTKFSTWLPEGVPDRFAAFSARPAKRPSSRVVPKRSRGKTPQP